MLSPPTDPSAQGRTRGKLVLVFAIQVLVGTALFVLIAAVAVALNVCANWLEANHLIDGLIGTILLE